MKAMILCVVTMFVWLVTLLIGPVNAEPLEAKTYDLNNIAQLVEYTGYNIQRINKNESKLFPYTGYVYDKYTSIDVVATFLMNIKNGVVTLVKLPEKIGSIDNVLEHNGTEYALFVKDSGLHHSIYKSSLVNLSNLTVAEMGVHEKPSIISYDKNSKPYLMVIKPIGTSNVFGPANVYKLYSMDGKEAGGTAGNNLSFVSQHEVMVTSEIKYYLTEGPAVATFGETINLVTGEKKRSRLN